MHDEDSDNGGSPEHSLVGIEIGRTASNVSEASEASTNQQVMQSLLGARNNSGKRSHRAESKAMMSLWKEFCVDEELPVEEQESPNFITGREIDLHKCRKFMLFMHASL